MYDFSPIVQAKNLDKFRDLEISNDEQKISCVAQFPFLLVKEGCLFITSNQSWFVSNGRSEIVRSLTSLTPLCVLGVDGNQVNLSYEQCRENSNSKKYLSGKYNFYEKPMAEVTFDELISKDPPKTYFTDKDNKWISSIDVCLTNNNSVNEPKLIFIHFYNSNKNYFDSYEGIPNALEAFQIGKFCENKWKLSSSLNLANSIKINDLTFKTADDLMEAYKNNLEQIYRYQNALGFHVKLKTEEYPAYKKIFADVSVFDVNGVPVAADELVITLNLNGDPTRSHCNGRGYCEVKREERGIYTGNKFICTSVKAVKNGVVSRAVLEGVKYSGCRIADDE